MLSEEAWISANFNILSTRIGTDVLILDKKYSYDLQWLLALRNQVGIVRVDHPHAETGTADLVVIPNAHQPDATVARLHRDFPSALLCGPEYAILPPDVPRQDDDADTLLFLTGGTNPGGLMEHFYEMTRGMALPGCRSFVYALGSLARFEPGLSLDARTERGRVLREFDRALYRRTRLAVSLFGVTTYELLAAGVPTLSIAHTDENVDGQELLAARSGGLIVPLGHVRELQAATLRTAIQRAWANDSWQRLVWERGPTLVDGQGAARVTGEILRRFG